VSKGSLGTFFYAVTLQRQSAERHEKFKIKNEQLKTKES